MELNYPSQSFGQAGQPNAGFISGLWLIAIDQVEFIGEPARCSFFDQPLTVSAADLVIQPDAAVIEIKFVRQQGSFSEIRTNSTDGPEYAVQLAAQLPRNEAELLAWLEKNSKRRWLAIWTDANRQTYLAGDPDNGMRLSINRVMGQTNAVQLQLQLKAWHTTWLLEDADLTTLFAYAQAYHSDLL